MKFKYWNTIIKRYDIFYWLRETLEDVHVHYMYVVSNISCERELTKSTVASIISHSLEVN